MENEFLASGGEWKEFLIGDIFNINTPKKRFDANKITFGGDYPYVARGDKNNGIRGYITEDTKYLNSGNTISFGQDTATMFYQENAYFTGDKIKVFSLKNGKLNKLNSQFLISAMKKSFGLFSWGSSSFSEENLKQAKIQLPIIDNEVAFGYIENYMRELQKERLRELQKERLRELKLYLDITGLSSYELTDDEINVMGGGNIHWNNYRIGDLFDTIKQGARLTKQDQTDGDLMFVMSGTTNTGIAGKIGNSKNQFPKNSLTIDIFGNVFYRNYEFGASDDVGVYYNSNKQIDKMSMLYLATSIQKNLIGKYDYGYKLRASKSYDLICQLPTKNNQIDFDYMASFIKAIQKLIIKDLVLYTKRELQAYQTAIGV